MQKGDTVTVTAPGYYPQAVSTSSFAFSLASFVASLLQQPAPAPGTDGSRRGALPLLRIGVSAALPALVKPSGGVPLAHRTGKRTIHFYSPTSNIFSCFIYTNRCGKCLSSIC